MKSAGYFVVILLLAVLFALVISAPFFEAADNALVGAGASFDGDLPPCRADRVGVTLTLKGTPSVCQATATGYQWTPMTAPAPVAPASVPQTASDYQPCTKAQHGKLTGDGRWLCIEDGRNPGSYRWRPWPER
jgi:hypothetical protein